MPLIDLDALNQYHLDHGLRPIGQPLPGPDAPTMQRIMSDALRGILPADSDLTYDKAMLDHYDHCMEVIDGLKPGQFIDQVDYGAE